MEPTPYQLRATSSSAVVAPASTVIVVCFTVAASAVIVEEEGVNVSAYCCLFRPTFARRMSDCHRELMPSRWPTEGMISTFANVVVFFVGVTGVTRLTETGTEIVVEPSTRAPLPEVDTGVRTRTSVPVNV